MSIPWRPGQPGSSVVEPTDNRGARFVGFGLSQACVIKLCAVARKHGGMGPQLITPTFRCDPLAATIR